MADICVAVADGHALVRQALCALLRGCGGVSVVGDAGSVAEALACAGDRTAAVVIYDPTTVPDGGPEALGRIRRGAPAVRFVALTGDTRETSVGEAVRAGARAYVLKSNGLESLVVAMREAAAGRHWFDSAITQRDPDAFAAELRTAPGDPCHRLTSREREVLWFVVAGLRNAEIASRLGISRNTVGVHRGRLMRKLDLHSEADVVRFAVRHGLVSFVHPL